MTSYWQPSYRKFQAPRRPRRSCRRAPSSRNISSSRGVILPVGLARTAADEQVTVSARCGEMKFSPAATFMTALTSAAVVPFRYITLRTRFNRADDKGRIVVHAEHDDFGSGIVFPNSPHQFETGNVRQIDIDDRNVGLVFHKGEIKGFVISAPSIFTEEFEANKDLQPETITGWSSTIKSFVSNF